jgi:hypothetical protein
MSNTKGTMQRRAVLIWGGLSLAGLCISAVLLVAGGWILFRTHSSPGTGLLRTPTPGEELRTQPPPPPTAAPTDAPMPSSTTARPLPPTVAATETAAPAGTPIPPTLTPPPTETPIPPTATPPPTGTSVPATETLSPTPTPIPATVTLPPSSTPIPPTATSAPTATPTPIIAPPRPTATTAPPTATPSPTSESSLSQVSGRVVRDGTPVGAGVIVELEGHDTPRTTTNADGRYTFDSASLEGTFRVVFAQGWNAQLYTADQVASWAWLEGVVALDDLTTKLPDLEVSLEVSSQRFEQAVPAAGASFPLGQISSQAPLSFEWTPYPGHVSYWVDLGREGETVPVWQSYMTSATSVSFDGTLDDGTSMAAGAYWWNVGAWKPIGVYKSFVYGWPRSLTIGP